MTLYVSRHARHVIEIWSGNQEMVNVNGSPKMVTRMPQLAVEFEPKGLTEPQRRAAASVFGMVDYGRETIMLPNSIDLGDGEVGTMGWRPGVSPTAAAGAFPRAHDDIILGPAGPEATTGYDPQFHLGRYNTGDCKDAKGKWVADPNCMIPFQSVNAHTEAEKLKVWEVVEEVLHASDDFGVAFIAVDMSTIPLPFPTYLKIKGDTAHAIEQMKFACEAVGFNYGPIFEYERDVHPLGHRPNMLAFLEQAYREQQQEAERQARVAAGLEATV